MQAQQSIITRPRRAAAKAALQNIKRIALAQQRQPQVQVAANIQVNNADDEQVTTCPLCTQPIRLDEDIERCQACLTWVHHACVQPLVEAFDWTCRGLCGHPDVNLARQQCPLPNCAQAFRLDQAANEARWLALFRTRMWRRYSRDPHIKLILVQPPFAPGNPYYLDRLRPRAQWWVARNAAVSNAPERRVLSPDTPNIQWNQAGHPKRMLNQPYLMFRAWTNAQAQHLPLARFFRHQKFFVQPRLPMAENAAHQRYVFTDLNVLIHGDRLKWRRMCKYYDDHGITIADMQNL